MRVPRLKVANMRAIEAAEFRFQPGFNLVVGVNGVGKTTVLDAIAVCLSAAVKHLNGLRTRAESFEREDIRVGAAALDVECDIQIGGDEHTYLVHKPRETSAARASKAGHPREDAHATPETARFMGPAPRAIDGSADGGRPFAVLFSTNRAVPSERAPAKSVAAGGVPAAFSGAFSNRELRLGEFAAWMKVQEALKGERPESARVLEAFEAAVTRFLPGYSHLHLGGEDGKQLMIDHESRTLLARQLSDGERGTLALVLDLTRRLSQANPELRVPAEESEAVVLIDEIDLHLHPKWQRQIVRNLTAAFPRCQFIATTHSPQVIGEVGHECIQIISDGLVYSPLHSFGLDSSQVLEAIMDANSRTVDANDLLEKIKNEVSANDLSQARTSLESLVEMLGEGDPEVTRIRTLLDFMEESE